MSLPNELSRDELAEHISQGGVESTIRQLVTNQPYAVLCTQGQGQPYGSLIAYAITADLAWAVFATLKATRKFRLLAECDRVALLIDDRSALPGQLMEVEAVTATGQASLVERGEEFERCAALLIEKHPELSLFVRGESCGLFRIQIFQYLHVTRFQEVQQWLPIPQRVADSIAEEKAVL